MNERNELRVLHALNRGLRFASEMIEESINSGDLYPVLARLENSGEIGSNWTPPPAGGLVDQKPRRKLYFLTVKGLERVEATTDPGPSRWHQISNWIIDRLEGMFS